MQHEESRWRWECGCNAGAEWACEVAVPNPKRRVWQSGFLRYQRVGYLSI